MKIGFANNLFSTRFFFPVHFRSLSIKQTLIISHLFDSLFQIYLLYILLGFYVYVDEYVIW